MNLLNYMLIICGSRNITIGSARDIFINFHHYRLYFTIIFALTIKFGAWQKEADSKPLNFLPALNLIQKHKAV
jgi:hypothetical protein